MQYNEPDIVKFQMLGHLYKCMMEDRTCQDGELTPSCDYFSIPNALWYAIVKDLHNNNLVEGAYVKEYLSGERVATLHHPSITLDGINYLKENERMRVAFEQFKTVAHSIKWMTEVAMLMGMSG